MKCRGKFVLNEVEARKTEGERERETTEEGVIKRPPMIENGGKETPRGTIL